MMTLEEAIKHCKDVALSCTNKECALEHFQLLKWLQEYSNMLEKQGNLMKALQISNAKIGELIEKNYYLKEQLEKQGNNMGISEVTKQELEDNLNKALEKETPESCNEFLDEQGEPKKHDVCDNCEQQGGCVSPCPMKLVEKQGEQKPVEPQQDMLSQEKYAKAVDECVYGEQKPVVILKFRVGDTIKNKKTNKIFTISDYSLLYEYYHDINHYHEIKFSEQDEWELVEQPAWSEEDIELLDNTIKFIEDRVAATSPSLRTYSPTLTGKEIPFLKALKDRVQPQPKQEWSEEDYNEIETIACHLDNTDNEGLAEVLRNIRNKYYHIIPQSQWKPSDEQLKAIKWIMDGDSPENWIVTLANLYNDLKKLKG